MNSGTWAWATLVAGIAAYDTWAIAKGGATMTEVFRNGLSHRQMRWIVGGLWGITTLHLFRALPARVDPFHRYGMALAKVRRST